METNAEHAEMEEIGGAIGALILWANFIDDQLSQALVLSLALPEHPMMGALIAQLDARPKAELLKKRFRLLPKENEWRQNVDKWVRDSEKALKYRNIVAHHQTRLDDAGRITLFSPQLGKILDSIKPRMQLVAGHGIDDIKGWIEHAQATHQRGIIILDNLERFATTARDTKTRKN